MMMISGPCGFVMYNLVWLRMRERERVRVWIVDTKNLLHMPICHSRGCVLFGQ